ncbi:hypothetical protein MPSEU_000503300 [Mayamaea pseudoterrestris]|nr:hypothetical protein MPSEU_000503300 [Mayamaea pseudoterrestris]
MNEQRSNDPKELLSPSYRASCWHPTQMMHYEEKRQSSKSIGAKVWIFLAMASQMGVICSSKSDQTGWIQAKPMTRTTWMKYSSQQHSIIESEAIFGLNDNDVSLDESYRLRFTGVGRLYQSSTHPSLDEPLYRLQKATVAVIGLGGVGSWAAEALVRSGIGHIVLIDLDDICVSNTNRQLHALTSTVGQFKIDAMQQRLLQINPNVNVTLIHDFVNADNVHDLLNPQWTAVVDAIDGSRGKSALLAACADLRMPVVTCGAAAGRVDPTQIRVGDLTIVEGDKLLASCRKELRKYHGFAQGYSFRDKQKLNKKPKQFHIQTVYSLEEQRTALVQSDTAQSLRVCDSALGTACFVTGTYGFVAAGRIIDMIVNDKLLSPRR